MKNKKDCWLLNKKCVEIEPKGYYGFTYCITDDKGKKYYGKKAFTHRTKTKLSKRAKALPENKGKRVSIGTKNSGWLTYWGSCKPLLEYIAKNGNSGFKREVVKLCLTKQDLAYYEAELLIKERVLFRDDCWNGNVLSKFFKGKINE